MEQSTTGRPRIRVVVHRVEALYSRVPHAMMSPHLPRGVSITHAGCWKHTYRATSNPTVTGVRALFNHALMDTQLPLLK